MWSLPENNAIKIKEHIRYVQIKTWRRLKEVQVIKYVPLWASVIALSHAKSFLQEWYKMACLQFATCHVGNTTNMCKNVLWSEKMKIELPGQHAKRCLAEISTMKHGSGNIMLFGCWGQVMVGTWMKLETIKLDVGVKFCHWAEQRP